MLAIGKLPKCYLNLRFTFYWAIENLTSVKVSMCSAILFISYPKDEIIDLGQILDPKIWK